MTAGRVQAGLARGKGEGISGDAQAHAYHRNLTSPYLDIRHRERFGFSRATTGGDAVNSNEHRRMLSPGIN
jgi:hypothetical protein